MQAVTIDRDKYIGGSDIPIIMGISPFKKRFDLLLEKANLKDGDFGGNEYTEYGNIMEPKIREYINQLGLSRKTYIEDKKIIGDIRCHVDGFNGETVLEIKTTSQIHSNVDDYKIYLVQLLFYMQHMEVEKGVLAVYERPEDFDETFDDKKLQIYYIDKANYNPLLERINQAVEQFRIDLEKVKENPFITEEELLPADLTTISNKLAMVEKQLVAYDELTKQQKELKAQLKAAMEKNGVKRWTTNSGILITLVPDGEDKEVYKFNEEKFKDDYTVLYAQYTEKTVQKGRAGHVKITLPKEEEDVLQTR